jgi:hypothetical protein
MYFAELQSRLIELARRRVSAGRITERGLAKLCGVSQPHIHNALKNIRTLSNASADRLMRALEVTVAELLWSGSGDKGIEVRAVPVLRSRLGPGSDAVLTVHRGMTPLPADLVAGLTEPVAALLAPDLALPRMVAANDMVLLDQNPAVRSAVPDAGVWIVAEEGSLRVRYLFSSLGDPAGRDGSFLYTANEATVADPGRWRAVSLAERGVLEIVRARIVWFGRQLS